VKRAQAFLLLGALLAVTWLLHTSGFLYIVGGTGAIGGRRLAFVLSLFYATALLCSALPARRFALLFLVSLAQLFVLYGPVRSTGALAIWIAFYAIVNLVPSWWVKAPLLLALLAAPFVVARLRPDSAWMGIFLVTHFASNFVLRSALYAYEATSKRELLRGAGLPGFLLCLIAAPLTAVKLAPIGFVVLHRGLRSSDDPALLPKGIRQIALGVLYLTIKEALGKTGVLPTYEQAVGFAGELNCLSAFALCHLLLVRVFLDVTGHVHLAIGMLRALGFDIPAGSDAPYRSRNVLDYWRRWNTYYRDYLLVLAYYPAVMALRKRPYFAVAVAGSLAFLLSGFAHAMQILVRHPGEVTLQRFLEAHAWAVVYGAIVVLWMVREARASRAGGQRRGPETPAGVGSALRHVMASAVTMTVVSLVLLLLLPVLADLPLSSAAKILAGFFRAPSWG